MNAADARKLSAEMSYTHSDYKFKEIVEKIKIECEQGRFYLSTNWPGKNVVERLEKNGYQVVSGLQYNELFITVTW